VVGLPWAADSCPWVGKLRTVLPLSDVIRDSAVVFTLAGGGGEGIAIKEMKEDGEVVRFRPKRQEVQEVGWQGPRAR
jgi:hypothetical protein